MGSSAEKIKEFLDKLTDGGKPASINFKKPYKAAKLEIKETDPNYVLSGENDAEVMRVIKAVVAAEEPKSTQFLTLLISMPFMSEITS